MAVNVRLESLIYNWSRICNRTLLRVIESAGSDDITLSARFISHQEKTISSILMFIQTKLIQQPAEKKIDDT